MGDGDRWWVSEVEKAQAAWREVQRTESHGPDCFLCWAGDGDPRCQRCGCSVGFPGCQCDEGYLAGPCMSVAGNAATEASGPTEGDGS